MTDTVSKTKEIIEAARKRNVIESELNKTTSPASAGAVANLTKQEVEQKRDIAQAVAETKVQAVHGSLTGKINIDAMGDVKGDGGDAMNYEEGDPAKALGVPVYEHGLAATKDGVDELRPVAATVFGTRQLKRTEEEMNRGRDAIGFKSNRRTAEPVVTERIDTSTSTVVTDSSEDADGSAGKARAEAKATKAK